MGSSHPNAAASGTTTLFSAVLVWALGHWGVSLSAEVAVAISGLASTTVLFVGRRGIRGTLRSLRDGTGPTP